MNQHRVFACVPTYCEPQKVAELIQSFRCVRYRPFELFIINANSGDQTSNIISIEKSLVEFEINEISGVATEFWSATVNRGLRQIVQKAEEEDWVLLMNVDVKFKLDIISLLMCKALEQGYCQIGALGIANGHVISSGVKVKSWLLTLTQHPLAGFNINKVPDDLLIPVDYLPGRCMLFPVKCISQVGLIANKLLPHYGADYEFSRRLAKSNCLPYLYSDARVESDIKNTGKSVFASTMSLRERLSNLMIIKNPSNPKYRINFVFMTYPGYAIPTAIILYLIRTLLETCLGGDKLQKLFDNKERGFSK